MRVRSITLVTLVVLAAYGAVAESATPGTPEPVDAVDAAAAVDEMAESEAADATPELDDGVAVAESEDPVDELPRDAGSGATSASVQWVITQKMKAQLSELGYGPAEVAALDPERAAAIIRRSISRPTSGVPSNWKRGARPTSSGIRSAVRAVGKPFQTLPTPLGPVVAASLVGAIGMFGWSKAMAAGAAPVVKRALAPALVEVEPIEAPTQNVFVPDPDALWLDRVIDRFIFFLKSKLGK